MNYLNLQKEELKNEHEKLLKSYEELKQQNMKLDMSRGKPSSEQLEISLHMLDIVNSSSDCQSQSGIDCRNYGLLEGLPSCRELFSKLLKVKKEMVLVGGNSSLNLMFDAISTFMTKSPYEDTKPWCEIKDRKFLCPVPGYDRHFGITEYFGFQMIPIEMTEQGPDMDSIEKLIENDDSIKGIWCVPKYSNPQGITYSDETVKRFANLKPAAKDFRIMWDDAYCVHDITDNSDTLLSLYEECEKSGNIDLPILFASTSKITFPGSGVAAMAASLLNLSLFKKRLTFQTIGHDKINMLRHILFFNSVHNNSSIEDSLENFSDDNVYSGLLKHMGNHKKLLKPRFDVVLQELEKEIAPTKTASWTKPNGGYFVSVNILNGTAKEVVKLCKEAGLILTGAGATYPLGQDPNDSNIRIAPTYPSVDELTKAMKVFCVCVKLATTKKLLDK